MLIVHSHIIVFAICLHRCTYTLLVVPVGDIMIAYLSTQTGIQFTCYIHNVSMVINH